MGVEIELDSLGMIVRNLPQQPFNEGPVVVKCTNLCLKNQYEINLGGWGYLNVMSSGFPPGSTLK